MFVAMLVRAPGMRPCMERMTCHSIVPQGPREETPVHKGTGCVRGAFDGSTSHTRVSRTNDMGQSVPSMSSTIVSTFFSCVEDGISIVCDMAVPPLE